MAKSIIRGVDQRVPARPASMLARPGDHRPTNEPMRKITPT